MFDLSPDPSDRHRRTDVAGAVGGHARRRANTGRQRSVGRQGTTTARDVPHALPVPVRYEPLTRRLQPYGLRRLCRPNDRSLKVAWVDRFEVGAGEWRRTTRPEAF